VAVAPADLRLQLLDPRIGALERLILNQRTASKFIARVRNSKSGKIVKGWSKLGELIRILSSPIPSRTRVIFSAASGEQGGIVQSTILK
jgi:hypothetical protein